MRLQVRIADTAFNDVLGLCSATRRIPLVIWRFDNSGPMVDGLRLEVEGDTLYARLSLDGQSNDQTFFVGASAMGTTFDIGL